MVSLEEVQERVSETGSLQQISNLGRAIPMTKLVLDVDELIQIVTLYRPNRLGEIPGIVKTAIPATKSESSLVLEFVEGDIYD